MLKISIVYFIHIVYIYIYISGNTTKSYGCNMKVVYCVNILTYIIYYVSIYIYLNTQIQIMVVTWKARHVQLAIVRL